MKKKTSEIMNNHIPWVQGRPNGQFFIANPIIINATPDLVWDDATRIDKYAQLSKGEINASLPQGELKVGNIIHLELLGNQLLGKFVPASNEKITVVDNVKYTLAWERELPCHGGTTERYLVLEPRDNGKKTEAYLALKIPGSIGFFTKALKKNIEAAFNELNNGMKEEAEMKQLMQNKLK